jgi:hypothetical protein
MRAFFLRLIDSTDPGVSLRHFCFAIVVFASIVWLSVAISRPLSTTWIEAFGLLLAAVTGAKILGATTGKDDAK